MGQCVVTGNVPDGSGMKLARTPWQETTRNGKLVRFNMMYYMLGGCKDHPGYNVHQYIRLLETLKKERPDLDTNIVRYWFGELKDVQKHASRCFPDNTLCCLSYCCCLCGYWEKRFATNASRWNKELKEWQDNFNREVLMPKGMLIKLQSLCMYVALDDPHGNYTYQYATERWFAIAFTKEESEKLQSEPHIRGFTNDNKWCELDEANPFVCHPSDEFMAWVKPAKKPSEEELEKHGGLQLYAPTGCLGCLGSGGFGAFDGSEGGGY